MDSASHLPGGRYEYLQSHITYNSRDEYTDWKREWANHYGIITRCIRQHKQLVKSTVTLDETLRSAYIEQLHILRCKARLLLQIRIHAENYNLLFESKLHQFNTQTNIAYEY